MILIYLLNILSQFTKFENINDLFSSFNDEMMRIRKFLDRVDKENEFRDAYGLIVEQFAKIEQDYDYNLKKSIDSIDLFRKKYKTFFQFKLIRHPSLKKIIGLSKRILDYYQ